MAELVDGFTVQEAATTLGVSRIRVEHMIRNNQFHPERIGNQWIIPRHEVFRAHRVPRRNGRPFTPESCWSVIDELDNGNRSPAWLHDNWDRLSPRAVHTTGRMLPELIGDVFTHDHVVLGGAHAANAHGANARGNTPPVDIYIDERHAIGYMKHIGLRVATADPNATIHAVPQRWWTRLSKNRVVSLAVAFVDLMEAGDRAAPEAYRALRVGPSR